MKQETTYQQCTKTVMDSIADPDIRFDENGICNYYYDFMKGAKQHIKIDNEGQKELETLINKIQEDGRNKPYDCIMGLSGGVDSSYVAYLCKKFGLRPLAVHFDNGWNSELAVKNIESMVNKCGFDLHTLVVDWEEFKDIQLSYLKASVVDIEVPTDHAISGALIRLALKHNIKYSLVGSNVNTEFIMPKSWNFNKSDHINLLDIHKKFGSKKLKTYPVYNTALKKRLTWSGMQFINILNYTDYHKQNAKDTISKELGWRDYGGKHYESLFTKFYQAYILPEKFGIDKRKPHLTNMICSGEMTKEQAVNELREPLYASNVFQQEKEFFLKKLGLTEDDWQRILKTPRRSHYDFATERPLDQRYKVLKPVKYIYRKLKGESQ